MEKYKTSVLEYEDVQSAMRYNWSEGWDKGWNKGWGEAWDKAWGDRSYDIAQNMLRKNYATDEIANITGLSIDEILKLRIN